MNHNTSKHELENSFPERFLRRREVTLMTTLPTSTITDMVKAGTFPAPLKLSERSAVWKMSTVMAWMDSCKPQRNGGAV